MVEKKTTRAKRASARKQIAEGESYFCGVCGLAVVVDEVCGCVGVCDIICCGKPMKVKVAKPKTAKATKK